MNSGLFQYKIAAFYKFIYLAVEDLAVLRNAIQVAMQERKIVGTVILAVEGINCTVCGSEAAMDGLVGELSEMLASPIEPKYSYSDKPPFRKIDVKIKPEIVTLKREVEIGLGRGTHVSPN